MMWETINAPHQVGKMGTVQKRKMREKTQRGWKQKNPVVKKNNRGNLRLNTVGSYRSGRLCLTQIRPA